MVGVSGCLAPDKRNWDHEWDLNSLLAKTMPPFAALRRGKYRKYIYHDGGIVGGGDIKSNEQLSLLKDKEWVLSEQMVKNLSTQIERVNQLRSAWAPGQSPTFVGKSLIPDLLKLNSGSTINNVTNNSNKPVQITFGDTNIYGADEKTVTQHIEVTRRFANEVFGQLNIKK